MGAGLFSGRGTFRSTVEPVFIGGINGACDGTNGPITIVDIFCGNAALVGARTFLAGFDGAGLSLPWRLTGKDVTVSGRLDLTIVGLALIGIVPVVLLSGSGAFFMKGSPLTLGAGG